MSNIKVKTILTIPQKAKAGILKTIDAIRDLFGPHGEHWMLGEEHATFYEGDEHPNTGKILKDRLDMFCLLGAVKDVSGPFEDDARLALALAIDENFGDDYDLNSEIDHEEVITSYNDTTDGGWRDILKVIKKAKKLVEEAATS